MLSSFFRENLNPLRSSFAINSRINEISYIIFLILFTCPFAITNAQTACSLGDPVFIENFGSGSNRLGPSLNQDPYNVHPNFRPAQLYSYVGSGSVGFNEYGILKNPIDAAPGGADWNNSFTDHTGNENGYMYYCDARTELNVFYAQKITEVCAEIEYELSAWFAKSNAPDYYIDPDIKLIVGFTDSNDINLGVVEVNTGPIEGVGSNRWHRKTIVFTIPVNTENVYFMLKNNVAGTEGNDLVIDDIEVRPCGPQVNFLNLLTNELIDENLVLCLNNPNNLRINIESNLSSDYSMQWQESNGEEIWTDIPGQTSNILDYQLSFLTNSNQRIRLKFAHNSDNLINSNCFFYSEEILIGKAFANNVNNIVVCDNLDDGSDSNGIIQNINLESQSSLVLGTEQSDDDFTVSYHLSNLDAISGDNPLTSPHENKLSPYSQTIFIRVQNNNTGCANSGLSFEIIVNKLPTANTVGPIFVCDDQIDGDSSNGVAQSFNLHSQTDAILGTAQLNDEFDVTYHLSSLDASTGANPLSSPHANNLSPYAQTIYVRIQNKETLCINPHLTFEVLVNPIPNFYSVPDVEVCDNNADGNFSNGIVQNINFALQTSSIQNESLFPNDIKISYHISANDATSGANSISSPYQNVIPNSQTIYVRILNEITGCINPFLSFKIVVNPLPIVSSKVFLKQCDVDTDGFSLINLTEAQNKISSNFEQESFMYFNSINDASLGVNEIPNPTSYLNKTVNSDIIWVRTISQKGCYRISEIEVIVTATFIPLSFQQELSKCDDFLDIDGANNANNDNRDGISSFNFSHITNEVLNLFPVGHQISIQYYRNENDALSELNPIVDTANYRNIGYPSTQDIYIRVDSEVNNDCLGFGHYITLNVEELPIAHQVSDFRQCDDDQDGMFPFDISSLESNLLQGQQHVEITYFDQWDNLLPSPLPNPFITATQEIRVRVSNKSASDSLGSCFEESSIRFIVDNLPLAFEVGAIEVCDSDYDGIYNFSTNGLHEKILNGQDNMEVRYFDESGNELASPLPDPFISSTQSITVEVVNPVNLACLATTNIDFVVNPRPSFSIVESQVLCLTSPQSPILLEVIIYEDQTEEFDYSWTSEDGVELSNTPTLSTMEPGYYSITITKIDGTGCSNTETIEVIASEIASISPKDIEIEDDSENNIIRINNSDLGQGDYEFSLDDDFSFQDEPEFNFVESGFHTIYIRDKNGCGTTSIEVSVIGFPKYFTPNFDGHNDTWKVHGVDERFYPDAKIYVFDRFGKMILQIHPDSEGWDGSLNSKLLPSTDYWFYAELIDINNNLRIKNGHFSLIRK